MEQTTKASELEKNLRYFSVYKKLPMIVMIVILVLSFVWGIVDACVFIQFHHGYFGVMRLPNGFLCWFIWMIIGSVFAVCVYFLMKINLSHRLLQIYYLQLIAKRGPLVLNGNVQDPSSQQSGTNQPSEKKNYYDLKTW